MKARRFKVRGEPTVGHEVERDGSRITLNVAPPNWPFPRLRSFDRAALVRIDGDNTEDQAAEKAEAPACW